MPSLSQPPFSGVLTALITPFLEDESIDWAALDGLIETQINNGIHGLVIAGTTGESATLLEKECLLLAQRAMEQAKGRVPIVVAAGSNSTKQACHLHRFMHEIGVAATLQITPYYNRPTQEGLYRHFLSIAQSAPTPLILYNVPTRTGIDLEPQTIFRLAETCPNIIGLKDANTNMERVQSILLGLRNIRNDFTLLSGCDTLTLPFLAIGAHGVISVTSNVRPQEMAYFYEAWQRGDIQQAQRLAWRVHKFHILMSCATNPIPVKTALACLNKIKPVFRLPLCPLQNEELKKFEADFHLELRKL